MKKRFVLIGVPVFLVIVGTLVFWGQYQKRNAELYYSGTLEFTESNLAFQAPGRVRQVYLDEGQSVKAGQCIAELSPEEYIAARNQAGAVLNQAMDSRKQLESMLELYEKTLPAAVTQAEAAVNTAKAQLAEQEAGNRVQEVERAKLSVQEAEINRDNALKDKQRYDNLFRNGFIAEKDRDSVTVKYENELKAYQRAVSAYNMAREGFRKESIAAARARFAEAQAALRLSKGNLKKIDAAQADIQAATARIQAARAALDASEIQLGYTRLTAPFDAMITSRNVEPGEVVTPSREVITLADVSRIDLKVFVDETQIGKVHPGQKADVRIDTFPDKVYSGVVSYVSPEGEFTPKIIQTRKERVKLVYLVKIAMTNPNDELKSGMPADAWFR